jgi:hypothetical protein
MNVSTKLEAPRTRIRHLKTPGPTGVWGPAASPSSARATWLGFGRGRFLPMEVFCDPAQRGMNTYIKEDKGR